MCDFDGDGFCDGGDIDALMNEIAAGTNTLFFDISGDCAVDKADFSSWLVRAAFVNGFSAPYLLGDANLDGVVASTDLNQLAVNWLRDGVAWSGGDFNADGGINAADLNELALNWLQAIPSGIASPVPESSPLLLTVFGLTFVWRRSTVSEYTRQQRTKRQGPATPDRLDRESSSQNLVN